MNNSNKQLNFKTFDAGISLARISGMIMIVFCHLSDFLGFSVIAQVLNVGVYLFLFISGFLYAEKDIPNALIFLKQRFLRISVPIYIFAFPLIIISAIFEKDKSVLYNLLIYAFNLEGIGFISPIKINPLHSISHLWFITVLLICYLFLLVVKQIEKELKPSKKLCVLMLATICIVNIFTCYAGFMLIYFVTFYAGYVEAKYFNKMSRKKFIFSTAIMMAVMAFRLISHLKLDSTKAYSSIIVPLTHLALAVWIFMFFKFIQFKAPDFIQKTALLAPVRFMDKISYYIYIVHYVFLFGNFSLSRYNFNPALTVLIFFLCVFIISYLLMYIDNFIQKQFSKKSVKTAAD